MDGLELRCKYTRTFRRLLAVQAAHRKAHLHVERMQAVKPTASREALEAALAKRRRTSYAYVVLMRKQEELEFRMRELGLSNMNVLCSAGMSGECRDCRNGSKCPQGWLGLSKSGPRMKRLIVKETLHVLPMNLSDHVAPDREGGL